MIADGWTSAAPVGWLLAGALAALKATVVLMVASGAVRLLEGRSAALRHWVWTVALGVVVVLPALGVGWPDGLRIDAVDLPSGWADAVASAGADRAVPDGSFPGPEVDRAAAGTASPGGQSGVGETLPSGVTVETAGWVLLLVWGAGAAVVLAKTVGGAWRLRRVRRRAAPLGDEVWRSRILRKWDEMGGEGTPRVRMSPEISAPLTTGVIRPTLLLPQEALDTWTRSRTESVLVHELAHLRRRDTVVQLVGRAACAIYWFHPLVWWAARSAGEERERACDDAVLRAGCRASEYARHLLATAREAGAGIAAQGVSVSVARGPGLEGRILSVLDGTADRRPVSGGTVAGAALPALGLAISLAALSVGGGAAAPDADPPHQTVDPGAASDAAIRVGSTGPERVLLALLDAPDPEVRSAAAAAAGRREIADAVEPLTDALTDPSPSVRREAAGALAEIEDPSAVGGLSRVLVSDPSPGVRKAAAWALGETESEAAVAVLAESLGRAEGCRLDRRIARALGETRQPSAVPVLRGLLDSSDPGLRRAAVEGLTENGTDRARSALDAVLESDDPELRTLAADVLGRAG